MRAEAAHQALRQHADQARTQEKGLDAHVLQASHGADRVVGVQGGDHQVAGQAGLDGDLRGFQVADLTHQDDIRVLAQDGAQGAREAHVDAGVDLGLADAIEVILDGVFHGHDVERGVVQARQRRVQGRGLA